jgi:CheY-like chemotaxis protein
MNEPAFINNDSMKPKNTILIVDDSALVRELSKTILEEKGFRVLEAPNGLEALFVFIDNALSISLVILDLDMPIMNGLDCLIKLREEKENLPVVIASGYVPDELVNYFLSLSNCHVLAKPFMSEELLHVVQESLLTVA